MIDTNKKHSQKVRHLPPTKGLHVTIEPKIHNRFDVFRKNVETGVEEQVAYAENIVLNQMFTRLCGFSTYFSHIRYGTGTGTLAVTRTGLFTDLGYKAVTNVEKIYAVPTSSWRQSIELGLTDNNGAVLTEVGIAYGTGSTNLVTHAMLRDMNGNPVSITKTAVDILTIYATVYFTLDNSHASLKMYHPGDNDLITYLMGGSAPDTYVYAGENALAMDWPGRMFGASTTGGLGSSGAGTWTADAPNKRRTLATPRLGTTQGNGHITEIDMAHVARLLLPASGIYAGLDIAGATVGAGDGIVTDFNLPSRNVRDSGLAVKIDGATTTAFTKSLINGSAVACEQLYNYDTDQIQMIGISSDGLLACMRRSISGFKLYDRTGNVWVVRDQAPVGGWPADTSGSRIMFSTDKTVLMIGANVYDFSGGNWIKRPAITPPANLILSFEGTAISGNGLVLGVSVQQSERIYILDWVAGAWVARPGSGIVDGSYSIANLYFNYTGSVLVCRIQTAIRRAEWNGSTWTRPTTPGTIYPNWMVASADCNTVAINDTIYGGRVKLFRFTAGAWVLTTTYEGTNINNAGYSGAGSADLSRFCFGGQNAPYLVFYKLAGDVITEIPKSISCPGTAANGYMAMAGDGSYCFSYGSGSVAHVFPETTTELVFTTAPGLVTGEAVGTGDGSDATWDLDHTPITGSLTVKLDGSTTTAYTLGGSTITFDAAPGVGVAITASYRYACAITADYTVDGIHKTSTRVIDVTFTIQFGIPA